MWRVTMNRLFLAIVIIMTGTSASSGELSWGFKSPSFHHGNGYSTHVLSVEQLQFNRKEDIRKEAEAEQERIERECNIALIATSPSVVYKINMTDGTQVQIDNPCDLPSSSTIPWKS